MNGTDPDLVLDENGVCNHCHNAQRELKIAEESKPNLDKIIKQIKKDGKGKKYDMIVGISGGVDSSTAIHHAVNLGLRVYAITMDNGSNHSFADENILRIVETLKVPLYRYVLDLEKFERVYAAYMKAGVINLEAVYDHLLMASIYEVSSKYNVRWILSGGNVNSESVMPISWSFPARDLVNIKDIYYKTMGRNLKGSKNFPLCGVWRWNFYKWIKRIRTFYLLDYLEYNRQKSEQMLIEKYGFKSTGAKHEENERTKWFQSYWLFERYGIDKRLAHYSSLINSGQLSRESALRMLQDFPVYPYLGIEKRVLKYPKHSHYDYKTDWIFPLVSDIIRNIRKIYHYVKRISKCFECHKKQIYI